MQGAARSARRARSRDAGFDMDLDGTDSHSIQYQNANNSVRVTDEFMQAVARGRATGHLRRAHDRRGHRDGAGPGPLPPDRRGGLGVRRPGAAVRHDDQPLAHRAEHRPDQRPATRAASTCTSTTRPATWRASTCCTFLDEDGTLRRRRRSRRRSRSSSPPRRSSSATPTTRPRRSPRRRGASASSASATPTSARCSWRSGLPYDSDDGRAWAAAITALMTGHAYATSRADRGADGAVRRLPRERRADARRAADAPGRGRQDRRGAASPTELLSAAAGGLGRRRRARRESTACATPRRRVLAPTGTIWFLMDCDTTGVEPDLGLVKTKKLVGGGTMSIVNQTVPARAAPPRLRRRPDRRDRGLHRRAQVDPRRAAPAAGAPRRSSPARWATTPSTTSGHVKMMAAVQPFISGAISKTVNMPEDVTVEDVEQLHIDAWQHGPEGRRHLPRQLQGRPAAVDDEEGRRRVGDARTPAPTRETELHARIAELEERARRARRSAPPSTTRHAAAAAAALEHLRLPRRRLRGLRHRRRVRGRPPGRGLHEGLQAGLDALGRHGRLRRSRSASGSSTACRCRPSSASTPTCASSRRASPTTPSCASPRASSTTSSAGSRSTTSRSTSGSSSACSRPASGPSRRCPGLEDARPRRAAVRRRARALRRGRRQRGSRRRPTTSRPVMREPGRPVLLRLRQHHAAGGLVLRLPELRGDERLLVVCNRAE